MKSISEIKIRGYHVDHFGHVNHAEITNIFVDIKNGKVTPIRNKIVDVWHDLHKSK